MLNAVDGVTSTEGRILFMTTNYVDRLDPALIRPGRVDVKHYIGYCDRNQIRHMFTRFYPEVAKDVADQFAEEIIALEVPVSAAQIQGFLMFFKQSPQVALENVFRLKPKQ